MSEYQYYEFRAVDRPLTQKQMNALRRYSSRAEITQSGFVNVYNYGDFRGDPDRLMETYFDAFVYLANWGSRWFMLRIPGKLLGIKAVKAYCVDEYLSCHQKGSNVVLSFRYEDEEGYEWVEGEGWLASLLPIRADLLRGDLRALYIAWLLSVQSEEIDEDTREPPVPPGLDNLTAALNQFMLAEFLKTGAFDRHLRRLRMALNTQVNNASLAIGRHFPEETRLTAPGGGLLLWVELPDGADSLRIFNAARGEGITFLPGVINSADPDRYRNCLRISCAQPWTETHEAAMATLGRLVKADLAGGHHC